MWRIQYIWMLIWLANIKLSNSSGKLSIRFLQFKNNKRVNNGDCCDNVVWCTDACDIYLEICVTEVSQAKCNTDTFRTKVLGEGPTFSFPGIGGDLGNGKNNPLEYSFQKWQGFSLALELWDYDSGFLKGSSDFVDSLHLDINDAPDQNSTSARTKEKPIRSKSSPDDRSIDIEIKVYCDDKYLLPDCDQHCVPRDDVFGHYTCDYVRGFVVCHPHWYGDFCTLYCRSRDDAFGNYTCDKNGAKICARNWYGGNCSTFCKSTNDITGHFECDSLTGDKVCLPDWYGEDCLVFCKAQDNAGGHFLCNKTSGEKACLENWYGADCTKYCSPQNDRLLGHFICDVVGNKVCLPGWHGANCTQAITALITCYNKLELWVDDIWCGPDNGQWNTPWSFQISSNATLIAVKCVQFGNKGGILGSLSSGLVTDEAWKCTGRFHSNWMKLSYDDSSWLHAKTHGYNSANAWGKVPGIADNANWIWTADNKNDDVVYCRRILTEIAPTAAPKSPIPIQVITEAKTYLLSENANSQAKSTSPQTRQPTRPVRPIKITSSSLEIFPPTYAILSLSREIIKLHYSSITRSESVQIYSKQNDVSSMSPSLETLKQFSDIHYFLITTRERQEITSYPILKTTALSPSRMQTFPCSQVSESVLSASEQLSVLIRPSETEQIIEHQHTSIKSQSLLAISLHSLDASDRNYPSKSLTGDGVSKVYITETLDIRESLVPRTHQNFLNSKNNSTGSLNFTFRTSTQKLSHNTSPIRPSSTIYITKVSMDSKNKTVLNRSRTTSEGSRRSPVPPTRPPVITPSSTQVLPVDSLVMTSSNSTAAMNDGKGSKKDSFAFVFFPPVAFMIAVGLFICIRIKQRKLKVSPVPIDQLQMQDNTVQSSTIYKIPHSQSRQELLQMDVLLTKQR